MKQLRTPDRAHQPQLERRRRSGVRRMPQDPADPAYDWTVYDRAIRYAGAVRHAGAAHDPVHAVVGERRQARATSRRRNYTDLRNFAYAAATRYSGHYIRTRTTFDEVYLPAVKYWLAWNEPNNPNWLQQTSGRAVHQPALVRADLHGDLAGRPLHELRRREGRLRGDRAAWEQRAALVAGPRCRRSPS